MSAPSQNYMPLLTNIRDCLVWQWLEESVHFGSVEILIVASCSPCGTYSSACSVIEAAKDNVGIVETQPYIVQRCLELAHANSG